MMVTMHAMMMKNVMTTITATTQMTRRKRKKKRPKRCRHISGAIDKFFFTSFFTKSNYNSYLDDYNNGNDNKVPKLGWGTQEGRIK